MVVTNFSQRKRAGGRVKGAKSEARRADARSCAAVFNTS